MRYLLFFLSLVVVAAQSQDIKKPIPPVAGEAKTRNEKQNPPNGKQEITVNLPPTLNVTMSGKSQVDSEKKKAATYEEPSKWTDPVTWFTLVLAVANILLWHTTKGIVTEAKTASGIARDAANAATKSVDAFAAAERPYLFVQIHKDGDVTESVPGPGIFPTMSGCKILARNCGKTPAILTSLACKVMPLESPPIRIEDTNKTNVPAGGIVIAADKFQDFPSVFTVTKEEMTRIISGDIKLYCCGVVRYVNVFSKDVDFETSFCWSYEPINKTWYLEPSKLNHHT